MDTPYVKYTGESERELLVILSKLNPLTESCPSNIRLVPPLGNIELEYAFKESWLSLYRFYHGWRVACQQ